MSADAPQAAAPEVDAASRGARRRAAATVAVVVVLLVGVAVASGPPRPGGLYDPDGVGPGGLGALVELLEQVDVDVEVSTSLPSDTQTRLFIPRDGLPSGDQRAVSRWVEGGGTLVVAGPSPLHGSGSTVVDGPVSDLLGATARAPECSLPGIEEVTRVEHAHWTGVAVATGAAEPIRCFPLGDEVAWLTVSSVGQGRVVSLGSPAPFTNGALARADNAVLAAALLGPTPGATLTIVPPATVGEGDTPVTDLVPQGFRRLVILAAIAAAIAVVWRARRLGSPVEERLPPVLPSAELARSVAALLQRAGDRETAADRLRASAHHEAASRLGAPSQVGPEELVDLVVARGLVDRTTARMALTPEPVPDDATLEGVARACRTLRGAFRAPRRAVETPSDEEQVESQPER